MRQLTLLLVLIFSLPNIANAWWNEQWAYRKNITMDTTVAGVQLAETLSDYPVLVRLHTGNFKYFLDVKADGSDIRFMSADDKLPLKFHIEKFDPISEIALIWVKLPKLNANLNTDNIWMYYGNANAVSGADVAGTYDKKQVAVYHFKQGEILPKDSTAYANNISESTAMVNTVSLFGAGLKLEDNTSLKLTPSSNLRINPENGYTFSSWIRSPTATSDSIIFSATENDTVLMLGYDQTGLYVKANKAGVRISELRTAPLLTNTWQHVAFTVGSNQLKLFVDGVEAGSSATSLTEFGNNYIIGASSTGDRFLTAELDEIRIANTARMPMWLYANAKMDGQASKVLSYHEDENLQSGEGTSYFGIIIKNVTVDGWVVIFILIIMAVVSWMVMFMKSLFLNRVRKDTYAFMQEYLKLGNSDPAQLDVVESEFQAELETSSPITAALFGSHDHYQSSPIYHVYHRGIQEVQSRLGRAAGAQVNPDERVLHSKSLDAIRAGLDATVVRETQKLNNLMVLLTISISGGPFLGLLGTVVGVMITFAAIAAAGDVNINAIAPGISAALLATVAGLVVAIPALFGYNYLGSRIKELTADMHVFVDEFVTRVGEYYSDKGSE